MKHMGRYGDWLRQAENDLEWAEHSMKGGFFSQVCFICQQCAEKALKGYCLFKGFDQIRTHSLFRIVKDLGENGMLEKHARQLDIYYISARYPDAFPDGAPFDILTEEQGDLALRAAKEILQEIKKRIQNC
ncbi:MAG: hypothetical protein BM485_07955 [Desulfobulbaceae bacterium DB1]|nr:MAG: hypothetical protein BM485_07955 [Desulfobulbaceae bacterium DB1]